MHLPTLHLCQNIASGHSSSIHITETIAIPIYAGQFTLHQDLAIMWTAMVLREYNALGPRDRHGSQHVKTIAEISFFKYESLMFPIGEVRSLGEKWE